MAGEQSRPPDGRRDAAMLRTARFGLLIRHDNAGREFALRHRCGEGCGQGEATRLDGGEHAERLQDGVRSMTDAGVIDAAGR